MPSLALALQVAADIARQLRTSLVSVLDQNYITGARVRGLPYRRILVRHALRNACGPALVVLGNDFPIMLAGAVGAELAARLPNGAMLVVVPTLRRELSHQLREVTFGVADTVLLLHFVRRDGEYRRALTVLKSRGAKTEPRLSEYTIGSKGIELSQPGGSPRIY